MSGYLRNDVLLASTRFLYSNNAATCASNIKMRCDVCPPSSLRAYPILKTSEYFHPFFLHPTTNFMGIEVEIRTGTHSLSNSTGRLICTTDLNPTAHLQKGSNHQPLSSLSAAEVYKRPLSQNTCEALPCVNPPSLWFGAYQHEVGGSFGASHSTLAAFPFVGIFS